jgi:cyclomaltodextrinase
MKDHRAIPEEAKALKRSYIRIFGTKNQFWTNDILIPLENGKPVLDAAALTESDQQKNVIYFMMVDRFLNGDTTNDARSMIRAWMPRQISMGATSQD